MRRAAILARWRARGAQGHCAGESLARTRINPGLGAAISQLMSALEDVFRIFYTGHNLSREAREGQPRDAGARHRKATTPCMPCTAVRRGHLPSAPAARLLRKGNLLRHDKDTSDNDTRDNGTRDSGTRAECVERAEHAEHAHAEHAEHAEHSSGALRCAGPGCNERATDTCSACKNVVYCSRACGKLHWPVHKAECKSKAIKGAALSVARPPAQRKNASRACPKRATRALWARALPWKLPRWKA